MAKKSSSLNVVKHSYAVVAPCSEQAYPIPVSEWKYIKAKLGRLQTGFFGYQTFAWALFGVSASFIAGGLALPAEPAGITYGYRVVIWAIGACCFACWLLTLFFAYRQRTFSNSDRNGLVEHMSRMEARYTASTEEAVDLGVRVDEPEQSA